MPKEITPQLCNSANGSNTEEKRKGKKERHKCHSASSKKILALIFGSQKTHRSSPKSEGHKYKQHLAGRVDRKTGMQTFFPTYKLKYINSKTACSTQSTKCIHRVFDLFNFAQNLPLISAEGRVQPY